MVKIRILVGLEREIKAALDLDTVDELRAALKKVAHLIEETRHTGSAPTEPGVGYQELLRWFREGLAPCVLAVPKNPSVGYIVKAVTKAREIGLDEQQVRQLSDRLKNIYPSNRNPGVYALEFALGVATRLLSDAYDDSSSEYKYVNIHTGRID